MFLLKIFTNIKNKSLYFNFIDLGDSTEYLSNSPNPCYLSLTYFNYNA